MPYVFDFEDPVGVDPSQRTAVLGGKAANLTVMAAELGLPVPPGFTISTATCRAYLADGWPAGVDDEIRAHMARVERLVGRRFGDPADPLLVSVRSGAPVSMPGMMDTILDLGLTEEAAQGLAAVTGDVHFADDCRRRFGEMYRDIVGTEPPTDPWQQLRGAVEAVFRSWNSDRAKAYRLKEGIPNDLGTAVTVQAMVFGNRGADSATGVLFTRNPATGEALPYGDVMFDAQGEDVVAGTHRTEPLAVLDDRLPDVGRELREASDRLERHFGDLCDIEFTIERGRLWMLQVRVGKRSPQAALRIALEMAEDPAFPLSRADAVRRVAGVLAHPPTRSDRRTLSAQPITTGLPASPGVAIGEIVTSPDAALTAAGDGRTVILVRAETSPDDVPGMAKSAGILTARGGIASHAAVVARGWGIPAVVGASGVMVDDEGITVDGRRFAVGTTITIDGATGDVFEGAVQGGESVVPEATTLIGWARELGIPIGTAAEGGSPVGGAPADTTVPERVVAQEGAAADATDLLRMLLVKGLATTDTLAAALSTEPATIAALAESLVADGTAERATGAYRLSARGKLRALEVFRADREQLGPDLADAALEGFGALDRRMKDTVTAWQLRDLDGQQAINDHSDAAYDAGVLERLAELHRDTAGWFSPYVDRLPRLGAYRARLEQALSLAIGGDQRYVASPRVESYHGVWFELHEELIRLAGRRRSDEAAVDG